MFFSEELRHHHISHHFVYHCCSIRDRDEFFNAEISSVDKINLRFFSECEMIQCTVVTIFDQVFLLRERNISCAIVTIRDRQSSSLVIDVYDCKCVSLKLKLRLLNRRTCCRMRLRSFILEISSVNMSDDCTEVNLYMILFEIFSIVAFTILFTCVWIVNNVKDHFLMLRMLSREYLRMISIIWFVLFDYSSICEW